MEIPLTFEKLQKQIDSNRQRLELLFTKFQPLSGSIDSLNLSVNKLRLVSIEASKEVHERLDRIDVKLLQLHESQELIKSALEEILDGLKIKDDQRLKSLEERLQQLEAKP